MPESRGRRQPFSGHHPRCRARSDSLLARGRAPRQGGPETTSWRTVRSFASSAGSWTGCLRRARRTAPREMAVILAIVRHMDRGTRTCFPSYDRISRQTRVSRRDITRILQRHCDASPAPLLARRFTKERKSYLYELVLNPEDFARARDAQPKRPRRVRKAPQKSRGRLSSRRCARFPPSRHQCECDAPSDRTSFNAIAARRSPAGTTDAFTTWSGPFSQSRPRMPDRCAKRSY